MCPQAQVHWLPQWTVSSMLAASHSELLHLSPSLQEGFPWHQENLPSCKQEQSRVCCGNGWLHPQGQPATHRWWKLAAAFLLEILRNTCSSWFLRRLQQDWAPVATVGNIMEHLIAFSSFRLILPHFLIHASRDHLPNMNSIQVFQDMICRYSNQHSPNLFPLRYIQ